MNQGVPMPAREGGQEMQDGGGVPPTGGTPHHPSYSALRWGLRAVRHHSEGLARQIGEGPRREPAGRGREEPKSDGKGYIDREQSGMLP